jgi:glyoxylase-like metal-dependent hydrolase (beta-lactamase superfamily II)
MRVKQFIVNPFSMNCYVYFDDSSKDAVIIDPAVFSQSEKDNLLKFTDDNKLNVKYIINTHGHIDHILGNKFAKDNYNVPVYIHKKDEFMIAGANEQARFFGLDIPPPPPADEYADDETILKLGSCELNFLNTPGHSPGSICIIDHKNKNVFCGDLIFKNSVGRTDLQGGDMNTLLDSVKNKLFKICSDDYILFPGHMESTDIRSEKRSNQFLKSN